MADGKDIWLVVAGAAAATVPVLAQALLTHILTACRERDVRKREALQARLKQCTEAVSVYFDLFETTVDGEPEPERIKTAKRVLARAFGPRFASRSVANLLQGARGTGGVATEQLEFTDIETMRTYVASIERQLGLPKRPELESGRNSGLKRTE